MKIMTIATLIALSSAGCVMQSENEETYFDDVDTEALSEEMVEEAAVDEPENIVVPETVVKVDPSKLPTFRTLLVGVDHSASTITILDENEEVQDSMYAADCPLRDSDSYNVCRFELPVGEYIVEFGSVADFERPDDVVVSMRYFGTEVYGTYAAQPVRPREPKTWALPIGEPIEF